MPAAPAITPEVEARVQEYFGKHPDQAEVFARDYGSDMGRWLDAFVNWWDFNGGGVSDLGPYADEIGLLDSFGFGTTATDELGGPDDPGVEETVARKAIPALLGDVDRDVGRGQLRDALSKQVIAGGAGASEVLNRTQGGRFDGLAYMRDNPDVMAEFERQRQTNPSLDIHAFAEKHYLENGQREGRKPYYVQSAQLAGDFANADRTTTANVAASGDAMRANLGALQEATTAMQGNLTGALADRAAALSQQIATLNQNLDQLDATQRKALGDSIAAQQANLEQAIATQRQGLETQLAQLGNVATTEAQAKRAALTQEIAGLTAAQAPVAAARSQAAELQATAVNVGLERTRDQLTAEQAAQGYVGGSTIGDASLARATIDARQRAGEAVGAANLANASDTRDIGVRGATGARTISDALAGANRDIGTYGANTGFGLTTAGALGRQKLGDLGATGAQTLTNTTALSRAGIGALGANTSFQDQVFGADQKRSLSDALAQGTFGLTTANSANTLAANQAGNAAKATYNDNDYTRRLNAALGLTQIPGNVATTLTGLDNYAQSGLNRTQGLLNWWATNPTTPPTPGAVAVPAPTTGNDLARLGTGLVGGAFDWLKASQRNPYATTNAPAGGYTTNPNDIYNSGGLWQGQPGG